MEPNLIMQNSSNHWLLSHCDELVQLGFDLENKIIIVVTIIASSKLVIKISSQNYLFFLIAYRL